MGWAVYYRNQAAELPSGEKEEAFPVGKKVPKLHVPICDQRAHNPSPLSVPVRGSSLHLPCSTLRSPLVTPFKAVN